MPASQHLSCFKAYDVRGRIPDELNEELAYKIGRAFARFSRKDNFMIGYDARSYSEELYQALSRGLVAEGKIVRGIGMVATPQLHFYQMREGFAGGVMVTASHNPPEYNGLKVSRAQAIPEWLGNRLSGDGCE